MKNRLELAQHFAKLGFKRGAEIGVSKGVYSKVLLNNIPNLNLLSIDSWHKYHASSECYRITKELLSTYPGSTIIRSLSMEAVKQIPDESLDFVFIDASHDLKSVQEDIREWSKKVKKGGIVSGHDYAHTKYPDVTLAVNEYVRNNSLKLEIVGADISNPDVEERQPSWYFIKT